jgi:hypothetical protein
MSDTVRHRRFPRVLLAAALTLAAAAAAASTAAVSSAEASTAVASTAVASTAVASTGLAGTPPKIPGAPSRPAMLLPGSVELNGVYCNTSSDCWAVGIAESAKSAILNQIVHWNGTKWSKVAAPDPGGTKTHNESQLDAIRCTSASSCWAVGSYSNATKSGAQLLHWNGTQWTQAHVPVPSGKGIASDLFDVACTSANSCWAVGEYATFGSNNEVSYNFAVRWDGTTWSKVSMPNPAGTMNGDENSLFAIRCAGPDDCWAGGVFGTDDVVSLEVNQLLHWNGHKWSQASVPNPAGIMNGDYNSISGLSCTSASNCWAVGTDGTSSLSSSSYQNEVLHWNGHHWSKVTTPNPDGTGSGASNYLASVNCATPDNCWAVGTFGDNGSDQATSGAALHWKGTKWVLTTTPQPGGSDTSDETSLNDVRCVSAKDCWIVGFSRPDPNPDHDLTFHWNSVKWSAS